MSLPVARLPAAWMPGADTLADRIVLVAGAYGGLGGAVARWRVACRRHRGGDLAQQTPLLEQLYDAMLAAGSVRTSVIHPPEYGSGHAARVRTALAEGLERDFGRLDGIVHCAAAAYHRA